MNSCLVLGLGNPILSDDGIGLLVAAEVKNKISRPGLTVLESELCALSVLELLVGYDRAVIIDAIQTRNGVPGSIYQLDQLSALGSRHTNSIHSVNFATAIELGRQMSLDLPEEIVVLAIEVEDVTTFSQECTRRVKKAIPLCVQKVAEIVSSPIGQFSKTG